MLVLAGSLVGSAAAQTAPAPVRVGVLLDGTSEMTRSALSIFRAEMMAFFGADGPLVFDDRHVVSAGWTGAGARGALDQLFADPGVDVVVALGPIGSHELALRPAHGKPSIAAMVVDGALQGLPRSEGGSGVHNLTYIDAAYTTVRVLEQFHRILPFRSLAVLVHPGLVEAIPGLPEVVAQQAAALGFGLTIVRVEESGAAAVGLLPEGTDAVYLGPLERLAPASYDSLVGALTARRLPVFTVLGRYGVERGALAAYAPREDIERRARRTAVDIQRIRSGEDAATLPVVLAAIPELTLNLATASAIGFAPDWDVLIEADLVADAPPAPGPAWTLESAAREAVRVHADIRAAERDIAVSGEEVRRARAVLLPQVSASTTGTLVRDATAAASFGQQPERQLTGSLNISQVLISDDAWAGYGIAGRRQDARVAARRRTELDVVVEAATAYLSVLRTRAQAGVQRANVRRTRANLELAQLRELTGAAGLADVYRWQSELARARRAVLDADAQQRIAEVALNRMLERPLEEPFTLADATAADSAFITSEPRLFGYLGNAATFRTFRDFMVAEAVSSSPELRELDAGIAAQQRALRAAARGLWWPTLSVQASLSSSLARGGSGTHGLVLPPELPALPGAPDETWSIRFSLSRPLFTGLEREAARAEAGLELDRLAFVRRSLAYSVERQILSTLHLASASWAGIRQATEAADAARRNLDLITDAYAQGAVAVISLIDAQQSALDADQRAADAVYGFLADLLRVERAAGAFHLLRSARERDDLFARLDDYFRAAGVASGQPRGP
jgi:outer membrane protein TolC/ABC-type uncharacterized transport system substrate-binding protein